MEIALFPLRLKILFNLKKVFFDYLVKDKSIIRVKGFRYLSIEEGMLITDCEIVESEYHFLLGSPLPFLDYIRGDFTSIKKN